MLIKTRQHVSSPRPKENSKLILLTVTFVNSNTAYLLADNDETNNRAVNIHHLEIKAKLKKNKKQLYNECRCR